MISEELNIELGARLVASPAFEWLDGMLAVMRRADPLEDYRIRVQMPYTRPYVGMVPDLADDMTVYGLIVLLERIWKDPHVDRAVWLAPLPSGWWVHGLFMWNHNPVGYLHVPPANTRAEALVKAIEASEGRF